MRRTDESEPREEDAAQIRVARSGSEGGGYGTRLSDTLLMKNSPSASNGRRGMSAMQMMHVHRKRMWPRSRGERSHKFAGTGSRKEGTQQVQGEGRNTRCAAGDIGFEHLPNNRAISIIAMHCSHGTWNNSTKSTLFWNISPAWIGAIMGRGALFKAIAGGRSPRGARPDGQCGRSAAARAARRRARKTRSGHGVHRPRSCPPPAPAKCPSAANCPP